MSKFIRVIASLAAAALIACALCACGSSAPSSSMASSSTSSQASSQASKSSNSVTVITEAEGDYASGIHHAVVQVEGYDPITIELDADSAPVSVANFCELANNGYYNGLKFYRIVDGFCLQGGTKGNSASGQDDSLSPIIGEFADNGVANPLADEFKRGTVAMARTNVTNSAKSTFFVTLADSVNVSKSLDGKYAAFGTIDDAGMDTVDAIVADYLKYANGQAGSINDPSQMPVIESITITD